ncbi:MAG: M20/M25/M40 family metallo-hydrolase, partial [Bacteroidota bacterium]|nr:M20/M25/M40 family metallo-hydrolase [Bacteroidota bacterium]
MKQKIRFLLLFCLFVAFNTKAQNSVLQSIINNIQADSIKHNVEVLESFPSRFLFSEYQRQVAFYLKERMQNYGFDVEVDSFYVEDLYIISNVPMNSGWAYNVLCVKKGNDNSVDSSLFLGAHYDCISNREENFSDYEHFAPGADDNASGVATLLELARVWQQSNITSKHNLRIEFYAGEELNFVGSNHRLYQLAETWNTKVIGMINLDMVGYNKSDTLNINYYDNSSDLTSQAIEYTLLYSDLIPHLDMEYRERSDSWVFYSWGLKALFFTEHDFSPYYHTLQDSSTYLDFNYMKKICGITFALAFDILSSEEVSVGLEPISSIEIIKNDNKELVFCL